MKTVIIFAMCTLLACVYKDENIKPDGKKTDTLDARPQTSDELATPYEPKVQQCPLPEPDTSLAGVLIRNDESATSVIGRPRTFCFGETYCYGSSDGKEAAFFTMHPGDSRYSINEFEVRYSDKESGHYRRLHVAHFQTESNIRLGITKDAVLKRFGKCDAVAKDSTSVETLYYRVEQPNDTKSNILQRHNMPVYYSEYEFKNDKLVRFKFGFEYP